MDEGHHSAAKSWEKVFDRFPNAKVVNLTATPYRADDREIAGKLIYRYSFKRAMVKGYIKRLQAVYVAPSELTFTYEGDTRTYRLDDVLKLKEEEWFSRGGCPFAQVQRGHRYREPRPLGAAPTDEYAASSCGGCHGRIPDFPEQCVGKDGL